MDPTQRAGGLPGGPATLAVEPQRALALLAVHDEDESGELQASRREPEASLRVAFEGIAVGPGVYVDAADRRIRVRPEHLPLVAERVKGVFLRDLHREDLAASVGVVAGARVEGEEVRFTGDVRLAPYVELLRNFWRHIRFSLGFRYDPAKLVLADDGTYDLPTDFVVDHLALVPQGQYPNARLVRLLNQARGLQLSSPVGSAAPSSDEPERAVVSEVRSLPPPRPGTPAETTRVPAAPPPLSTPPGRTEPMPDETKELDELRLQRDEALKPAEKDRNDLERMRAEHARELGKARADLEAAAKLGDAARLELAQAKNRFAAEVMKLELGAGKDFDLDQRKKELTGLELGALDRLRGELRLAAAEAAEEAREEVAIAGPATYADRPAPAAAAPKRGSMDLDRLGFLDTLRLAAEQGAL